MCLRGLWHCDLDSVQFFIQPQSPNLCLLLFCYNHLVWLLSDSQICGNPYYNWVGPEVNLLWIFQKRVNSGLHFRKGQGEELSVAFWFSHGEFYCDHRLFSQQTSWHFVRAGKAQLLNTWSIFSDDRTSPNANAVSYYSFSYEILIHGGYICEGYICKTFPERRPVSFVHLTLSQCNVNGRSRRSLMPLICMCKWLHNIEARMQKICFGNVLWPASTVL